MEDIPADVMQAARELAARTSIHHSDHERIETIARALLAERERCAQVAENATVTVYYHWDAETPRQEPIQHRSDIADAIRRPSAT